MSMAQDPSQHYRHLGDAGSRYHSRQGSASSILAATTFGVPCNPLATPSSMSAYGSVSWPCSNTVSPSIWSQSHQGRVQWPSSSSNQERQSSYYGNYGGYAYMQRPYAYPMYASTQQPQFHHQHSMPPQSLRQNIDPQMLMVPPPMQSQLTGAHPSLQPVSHGSLVGPYMPAGAALQVPNVPQYSIRAPLQPYQSISPPDAVTPSTEYDLTSFSKFYVAVAAGIFMEKLTPAETSSLEQFVSSLLCATRLPKSTALMSFVFLNQWNRSWGSMTPNTSSRAHIVCSLVLANKMNDDNTFTNASWALVSGIPAQQITKLELQWLDILDWQLNLDENGIAEWNYWRKCWDNYERNTAPQCIPSPMSMQGVWAPGGFVYEPFSVAVC